MPWNNDGGSDWNSLRCSPIAEDPKRPGEPCTVFGSGVSGLDDCELGAMCWNVDPETGMGTCVAQCMGSEADPICVDPCTTCSIYAEGALQLCHPDCDPLIQDCDFAQACLLIDDRFGCVPDVSGDAGAIGDPCAYLNVCDPSLFCASADLVPGSDADGCCAAFCDLSAPDECPALLPGTACVALLPEGMSPEACDRDRGIVGACILAE